MTYARLLATGSGSLAVRLMIEGLPYEFVSDPAMEKTTSDGRIRVCCLEPMGKGIVIAERVNIPEAKLEAEGVSIRLYETQGEEVSKALAWQPDVERFVDATVSAAATSVTMASTTGIVVDDVVHLGTEAMLVTAVGATSLTVTRAYWNTTAQKHWSNEGGIPQRKLTNRPRRVRGRRAKVYLYGGGDDLTGDGTQVWIGQVTSEPRCTDAGEIWLLQLASIAKRLDSKWGGELDTPRRPRGVYYHWAAPLQVQIAENGALPKNGYFTGFYETQAAFVDALETWLATFKTDNSLANTYHAVATGDGRWTVQVVVDASVTEVWVRLFSEQDGLTSAAPADMLDSDTGLPIGGSTLATGQVLEPLWRNQTSDTRLAPRGYFGDSPTVPPDSSGDGAAYPPRRIYLSGPVDSSAWTSMSIDWPDGYSFDYFITTANATDNYIELQEYGSGGIDDPPERYGALSEPTMRPSRFLAQGTLADLRDALVADAPTYCNRGTSPFLTSADIADWTEVVNARVGALTTDREWNATKPFDVADLFTAEFQLLGVYPVIDSDGKVGIAAISLPNESMTAATSIDDEIVSVGWADLESGGQTLNRIVLKTIYSPKDDKWIGNPFEILDVDAYADDHVDRAITVEPRGRVRGGMFLGGALPDAFTVEQVAAAFAPLLGLFGAPYDIVTANVSWKLFGTLLGDFVSFSAIHLPNATNGVRPMADVGGVVIGRKWELGQAHGTLTILLTYQNVGGYAPTAQVSGAPSNVTGNQWDITVNATMYAPDASHNADAFFAAGDAIRVIEYDSESPTIKTGTIDSVNTSTHVIRVTLDASWTPGASTWELCYDTHAAVQTTQEVFAFMADSTGLVEGDNARTYS